MNDNSKSVLILDYGTFTPWAEKLAEYFASVKYYCPWKESCPTSNHLMIGKGLQGVERVNNFWDHIKESDLIFFPDVYDGDIQDHLREMGKLVWGSGKGEDMELKRFEMKQLMHKLGMPVNPTVRIVGLDALRDYLKENEDKYVKISLTRGDMESLHHETYKLTEPFLDELEHKLGAKKKVMEFIVEDPIPDAQEIGYDGWSIDGEFPSENVLCGIEVKDEAYAGVILPYASLSEPVKMVNEKLSPVMRKFGYRGFWSDEIRVNKDEAYLIDATCRAGSPPSEVYQELYSNWDEIITEGAQGRVSTPKAVAKYGVQVVLQSDWVSEDWMAVHYPPEISRWVKLKNKCVIDGQVYVVPLGHSIFGSVVGIGDSFEEAIERCVEASKQVKGQGIMCDLSSLGKAIEQIRESQENGISFGDVDLPKEEDVAKLVST